MVGEVVGEVVQERVGDVVGEVVAEGAGEEVGEVVGDNTLHRIGRRATCIRVVLVSQEQELAELEAGLQDVLNLQTEICAMQSELRDVLQGPCSPAGGTPDVAGAHEAVDKAVDWAPGAMGARQRCSPS